jgi:hypothetical protein
MKKGQKSKFPREAKTKLIQKKEIAEKKLKQANHSKFNKNKDLMDIKNQRNKNKKLKDNENHNFIMISKLKSFFFIIEK